MRRTVNQIRGLLLERGITLRKGRRYVNTALPGILEDAAAKLSGALRILLAQLKLELDQMAVRIDEADAVLNKTISTTRLPALYIFTHLSGSTPSILSAAMAVVTNAKYGGFSSSIALTLLIAIVPLCRMRYSPRVGTFPWHHGPRSFENHSTPGSWNGSTGYMIRCTTNAEASFCPGRNG
jgi:hypothetical protein